MTSEDELRIVRRVYARQILASAGVSDRRLEDAFAAVPRENYLGPGPWPILRPWGYVPTPTADPIYLYCDVLVGLLPERGLNNGMPSFHARVIASAEIREGEHVVHVGAGTGYYTAIMAHLVGSTGTVTAIEIDPALAERAAANFASTANVHVVTGDGVAVPFEAADVIYVNAGATRPADRWLDGLTDGGRLILPLTAKKRLPNVGVGSIAEEIVRHGVVFRIERRLDDYHARWVSAVAVYPCEGGRDDAAEAAIDAALQKGGWKEVKRLYRSDDIPDERCWLRAPGWCLAYS